MSAPTTIGFEAEVDTEEGGLCAQDWAPIMIDEGLWNVRREYEPDEDDDDDDYCFADYSDDYPEPHDNHCTCPACAWGGSLLRVHYDCSCDGELVSDPLPWPSDRARALLVHLGGLFHEHGQVPGRCAGFHVHVARQGRNAGRVIRWFRHYEPGLDAFARMDADGNRGYNAWLSGDRVVGGWSKPMDPPQQLGSHVPGKGMALAVREETFEFRLWNSVVTEWRMYLAIELSAAFVEAAARRTHNTTTAEAAPLTVVEFVWDHLDDTARGYATRHLLGERGAL